MKLVLIALLFFDFSCKSKLKSEIEGYLQNEDFISAAILCSEKKSQEIEKECEVGIKKAEEEINLILRDRIDLPFSKLHIDPNKREKIKILLQKNAHMNIKYFEIWKESVFEN